MELFYNLKIKEYIYLMFSLNDKPLPRKEFHLIKSLSLDVNER
jgi:hypothetical protein